MADDDLTAIPGLVEKHRRILAEQLQVTTYEALAHADRQTILDAMLRVRPRLTLAEIGQWQDDARRKLSPGSPGGVPRSVGEASKGTAAWTQAATFVVSFEERRLEDRLERQLVVEQTELEPEQAPFVWTGWDCAEICGWMLDRLERPEPRQPDGDVTHDTPGTEPEKHTRATRTSTDRPQLRIEQAVVSDVIGRVDAVAEGMVTSTAGLGCTLPGRVAVTVAGLDPDRDVQVAFLLRRPSETRWSWQVEATMRSGRPTQIELSDIVVGQYDATLATWILDGSVDPAVIKLGTFLIRPPAQPPTPA